jgi:hypothetical protein
MTMHCCCCSRVNSGGDDDLSMIQNTRAALALERVAAVLWLCLDLGWSAKWQQQQQQRRSL